MPQFENPLVRLILLPLIFAALTFIAEVILRFVGTGIPPKTKPFSVWHRPRSSRKETKVQSKFLSLSQLKGFFVDKDVIVLDVVRHPILDLSNFQSFGMNLAIGALAIDFSNILDQRFSTNNSPIFLVLLLHLFCLFITILISILCHDDSPFPNMQRWGAFLAAFFGFIALAISFLAP